MMVRRQMHDGIPVHVSWCSSEKLCVSMAINVMLYVGSFACITFICMLTLCIDEYYLMRI